MLNSLILIQRILHRTSAQQIRLNTDFIVEEIHAHITETFNPGVTATTASR